MSASSILNVNRCPRVLHLASILSNFFLFFFSPHLFVRVPDDNILLLLPPNPTAVDKGQYKGLRRAVLLTIPEIRSTFPVRYTGTFQTIRRFVDANAAIRRTRSHFTRVRELSKP